MIRSSVGATSSREHVDASPGSSLISAKCVFPALVGAPLPGVDFAERLDLAADAASVSAVFCEFSLAGRMESPRSKFAHAKPPV